MIYSCPHALVIWGRVAGRGPLPVYDKRVVRCTADHARVTARIEGKVLHESGKRRWV